MHSSQKLSRRGFTLLEIMVVVLILGLLLSIAVPNWIIAKNNAAIKSCVGNLSKIDEAKMQYSMEYRKSDGDAVNWPELVPNYLRKEPKCPSTGSPYSINTVGESTTCPIAGHTH